MSLGEVSNVVTMMAALAFVVVYVRSGGAKASAEVIKVYESRDEVNKKEIDDLKQRVTMCEGLHRQNLEERGKMQGKLESKDDRIKYLENVLQNRNPEMLQFMKYITDVAQNSEAFMKRAEERDERVLTALQNVAEFMQRVNERFEADRPAA